LNPQAAQNYLKTKVMTATPEQLQMMLFDGALRFCEQAKIALTQKNYEQSFKALSSALAIVNQLVGGLKPEVLPELCEKLRALYVFAYKKLVDANLNHKMESIDEAIAVLKYQRETWAMVLDKIGKEKAANAARTLDIPDPNPQMERSISFSG
jgi:flagellar secretion chaperone FliS